MKETILVTGGFGFIGINLVRRLIESTEHSIIILSRKKPKNIPSELLRCNRVKIIYTDILQKTTLGKTIKKSTIIVHLAGNTNPLTSLENTTAIIKTNIIGTTNILEAAQKYQIKKIILLSSGGVYGDRAKKGGIDERHPLNPVNPYTASKLVADFIANSYFSKYSTPIVILRPFNVYGPYQDINRAIPIFITKLLKNEPIVLNQGGRQKRDFIYIDDLIDAIKLVLKAPINKVAGETFNISSDYGVEMRTIADIIVQKLGKNKSFLIIPKVSSPEVLDSIGSSGKIKMLLKWKPNYSLNRGLTETIAWHKSINNYEENK